MALIVFLLPTGQYCTGWHWLYCSGNLVLGGNDLTVLFLAVAIWYWVAMPVPAVVKASGRMRRWSTLAVKSGMSTALCK